MAWLMIIAGALVAAVACVVLPWRSRRARADGSSAEVRFPWFWAVFTVTCFAVAGAVGVVYAWPLSGGGTAGSWWSFSGTDHPAGQQFLSNEQFSRMTIEHTVRDQLRWALPVTAAVGAGLSAWAWRRGRV